MEKNKLMRWFIIGYGCALALIMVAGAFAIQLKVVANPFDLNLLTMLVILLTALHTLDYFSKRADDYPKTSDEKKGGLFGKK